MRMEEFIPEEEYTPKVEENKVIEERPDGSSDGLPEALDITLDDWSKECSNWNSGLHKIWDLEALCPEVTEPTAEDLVEAFNKKKEELYPGKAELTPKEQEEVYNHMDI